VNDHTDDVRQQWAVVRPDLDTRPFGVVGRLGRLVAYFDDEMAGWLGEFGLNRANWDVLASLRRTGEPYTVSPTMLYRGAMRTSGAMTHRLRSLEREGLVMRTPDPTDGRSLLVTLTPRGLALVDDVIGVHLANEAGLLEALSPEEREQLAALAKKLLLGFEQRAKERQREGHPKPGPSLIDGEVRPPER
jgi:DNA-binding MarR family transcriptional regulator